MPQSQGATNLCGFFATATAEMLLRNYLPGSRLLDRSLMRTHMYKCLKDASIQQFPQYSVQFHRNETVLDGEEPSPITFERTNSKLPGRSESNCQSTKKFMQSLQIREKDRIRKQLKRSTEELKTKEREISKRSKQKLRTDPLNKQKDQQMTKQSMAKYRQDPLNKQKDQQMSKQSKAKYREDPLNKQKDQQMTKQSMAKYREDPLNKQKDQQMTKQSMAKYREDPLNKQKDQQMTKQSKAKYREDPLNKQKDQQMSKQSKAKYREDPLNKQKDQQMTKRSKAKYREDPLNKQKDQQMTKRSMAKHREDPKAKDKDRERTRLIMQTRRLDKLVQDIEREKNRNYTRQKRQDPVISHKKTKKAHKNGHKTSTLKSTKQTANAKKAGKKRKCQHKSRRKKNYQNHNTIESASAQFKNAVAKGCMFVCTCCHQMWFENSVLPASSVKCDDEGLRRDCFSGKLSFDNKEWMCISCTTSIRKKKLPVLAYKNGMCFPDKPTVLELNSLEERLVAPVNPFMQLRELPSGGQVSIKGNVVNVPSDNVQTVTTLPRRLSESGTIPVKLKRRLRYKSHYMYENVRPEQCLEAVKYLLQKKLFQEYVVQGVDPQWLSSCSDQEHSSEWNEFIKQPSFNPETDNAEMHSTDDVLPTTANPSEVTLDMQDDVSIPDRLSTQERINEQEDMNAEDNINTQIIQNGKSTVNNECSKKTNDRQSQDDDSDAWSEEDETEEGPAGVFDTMMFDEIIDSDVSKCISIAPSEGNQPMSGINPDLEELAFPTIFCGERRENNKQRQRPVKYSEICKSELRREDRRAAISTANIFFKTKKLQYKMIQDKVWLSMKRLQSKGRTLTAGELRESHNIDQLVRLDEGYRIFRTLRGSPPYWEAAKKDIFAMLRQLGKPTWFLTLSAAETKWGDLLKTLSLLVDGKILTEEEAQNLSYNTRARLIRSDPVTTARYFHHRVQAFFTHFLRSSANPLGHVVDFFIRVEFQHRGSPHVHCLLWIEAAPVHTTDDPKIVHDFIDNYISTCNSVEFPDLIRRQSHRHTQTCRKKEKICRFGFPLPPMQTTQILSPLIDALPHEIKRHKENWSNAATAINELQLDSNLTFEDFLCEVGLTAHQYVMALRTTLKDDRVFLQRQPNATRINAYNSNVLKTWQANMDLQYITDAYACAMYIISYMSKGQRGMSDLMKRACSDAREQSSDIRKQVQSISNKFLRHVEISAQEAVYLTLQMPLRKSSTGFVFINTSPIEERPFLLKSQEILETLPDDSDDVKCSNIIQRYTERPRGTKQHNSS